MNTEIPFLLLITKPFTHLVPTVKKPDYKLKFKERCLWTGAVLLLFLICCQVPLYGVVRSNTTDPFYWLRVVIASNRGTLMELGITPIVTSSMVVQLLVSSNLLKIDPNNAAQTRLFEAAQRVFALMAILIESYLVVSSGLYGNYNELGAGNSLLIFTQLFVAGLVVLLLDELLENGYGLGSGISLFIATNVCESIFWQAFSPTTINTAKGMQFEGAAIEFFHVLFSRDASLARLIQMVQRENLPNIINLLGSLTIFAVCVYLEKVRVDLPLAKKGHRASCGSFPIKLLSVSNFPIILQSTLVSNLNFVSKTLFKLYKNNFVVLLLGAWDYVDGEYTAVGGLAYYLRPVTSFSEMAHEPVRFVLYFCLVMAMCGGFSLMWLDVSQSSPSKVARYIDSQGLVFFRKSRKDTFPILSRFLISSTLLGGMIVGVLTIFSDLIGSIGSGTGILLAVNLIFGYYQKYRLFEEGR